MKDKVKEKVSSNLESLQNLQQGLEYLTHVINQEPPIWFPTPEELEFIGNYPLKAQVIIQQFLFLVESKLYSEGNVLKLVWVVANGIELYIPTKLFPIIPPDNTEYLQTIHNCMYDNLPNIFRITASTRSFPMTELIEVLALYKKVVSSAMEPFFSEDKEKIEFIKQMVTELESLVDQSKATVNLTSKQQVTLGSLCLLPSAEKLTYQHALTKEKRKEWIQQGEDLFSKIFSNTPINSTYVLPVKTTQDRIKMAVEQKLKQINQQISILRQCEQAINKAEDHSWYPSLTDIDLLCAHLDYASDLFKTLQWLSEHQISTEANKEKLLKQLDKLHLFKAIVLTYNNPKFAQAFFDTWMDSLKTTSKEIIAQREPNPYEDTLNTRNKTWFDLSLNVKVSDIQKVLDLYANLLKTNTTEVHEYINLAMPTNRYTQFPYKDEDYYKAFNHLKLLAIGQPDQQMKLQAKPLYVLAVIACIAALPSENSKKQFYTTTQFVAEGKDLLNSVFGNDLASFISKLWMLNPKSYQHGPYSQTNGFPRRGEQFNFHKVAALIATPEHLREPIYQKLLQVDADFGSKGVPVILEKLCEAMQTCHFSEREVDCLEKGFQWLYGQGLFTEENRDILLKHPVLINYLELWSTWDKDAYYLQQSCYVSQSTIQELFDFTVEYGMVEEQLEALQSLGAGV